MTTESASAKAIGDGVSDGVGDDVGGGARGGVEDGVGEGVGDGAGARDGAWGGEGDGYGGSGGGGEAKLRAKETKATWNDKDHTLMFQQFKPVNDKEKRQDKRKMAKGEATRWSQDTPGQNRETKQDLRRHPPPPPAQHWRTKRTRDPTCRVGS